MAQAMAEELVTLRREADGICRLLLNRPAQGNAFSVGLVDGFLRALDAASDARLLVIEGAGRHFCTGFDLSGIADETDDSLLARFTRIELLLQRVARFDCPTVAVAHGRAMGAGADLFAACDHRVVAGSASFAFPGFRGFGLVLGSRRLAARVGQAKARDWITSGRLFDQAEALAAGLATGQVEGDAALQALIAALPDASFALQDPLICSALRGNAVVDDAADLAALVRSAARPGMQQRVAAYVAQRADTGRPAPPGPPPSAAARGPA